MSVFSCVADDFCGSLGGAIEKGSCMPGEHFTETQAWTLIAEVLGADWLGQRSQVFSQAECSIEITASGEWFSGAAMSEDARRLLDVFLPLVAAARPLVIAQLGQSLDGRIATESGASHYINGEPARQHLHRLRAIVDAVVVGVGTLNADDPQLTVRNAKVPTRRGWCSIRATGPIPPVGSLQMHSRQCGMWWQKVSPSTPPAALRAM
jgi:hypothetical protein